MSLVSGFANTLGYLIGLPLLFLLSGTMIHIVGFHIMPHVWRSAGEYTENPVLRGLFTAVVSVLVSSVMFAVWVWGCARTMQ